MILNSTIIVVLSAVDFYNKVLRLLFIFKKYLLLWVLRIILLIYSMICAVEMLDLLLCDFDVISISNMVAGFDNTCMRMWM